MAVPQPSKRTSGIEPNFRWDKSAYVLGVTAGEGKRTSLEHEAFVGRHRERLVGRPMADFKAVLRFLDGWSADQFIRLRLARGHEILDKLFLPSNKSERSTVLIIHDCPAARETSGEVNRVGR